MLRHAAVLAISLLLVGCADSVDLVSPDKVSGFKLNETNQTEVVANLGKPIHTVTEADGTKIDQYPYAGSSSGGSIVPSFLGGGSSSDSYRMVDFHYDRTGLLKEITGAK